MAPTDICFAHVLAQTQHDILYPEEWEYIKRTIVDIKLEKSLDVLRSKGKKATDWALLYLPLVKFMFHSFALTLESKKQVILNFH